MITKTIGKNTLGDNGKMKVQMRTYNRSTHNLSYIWRNTQTDLCIHVQDGHHMISKVQQQVGHQQQMIY